MRNAKTLFGLCILWALGACTPAPKVVYVNPVVLQPPMASNAPTAEVSIPGVPAQTGQVAGSKSTSLIFGISEDRYLDALNSQYENRAEAAKRLSERMFAALDAQIEDAQRLAQKTLDTEQERQMQLAIDETRATFERTNDRVFKLTYELSGIVGFPDDRRDPPLTEADKLRAEAIRNELADISQQYESDREAILESVRARIRRQQQVLTAELQGKRAKEAAKIEKQISELMKISAAQAVSPTMSRIGLKVPAEPAQTQVLPATQGTKTGFNKPTKPTFHADSVLSDMQIWAELNGYTLTENPTKGADKTAEFIAWRKEKTLGHWEK